jgi:chemotaxis protein MotA
MAEKKSTDMATVLGLLIAVGSLLTSMIMEFNELNPEFGSPFAKVSAVLMIFGGTAGAVLLGVSMEQFMRIPKLLIIALSGPKFDAAKLVETVSRLAELARREGLLRLESEVKDIEDYDKFLAKGLRLVVDGTDPKTVEDMLNKSVETMEKRHHEGVNLFGAMGGFAPTMGIVGTVVGLIGALSKAGEGGGDPNAIVEAIATAFIATFYGIGLANLIILPISAKLKLRSDTEVFFKKVEIEGILALQSGENPRLVFEKLRVLFKEGTLSDWKDAKG